MNTFNSLKEKLNPITTKIKKMLFLPVYMTNGAAIICEDKVNGVTKSTRIVAEHVNEDLDIPIEFPRFRVVKISVVDGLLSMHLKTVLILDTDDEPTEGSKNLLTSGAIYAAIANLQELIDSLVK